MLSGILVNKFFAIYFGAPGITLLAHFQNLVSLVTQVPNDGVNRGIIRYWSNPSLDSREKNHLLMAGLWLNLVIFLLSLVFIFMFRDYIFRYFNYSIVQTPSLWILFAAILVYILNLFFLSVILSFQYIKPYAILNLIGALAVAAAVIAGTGTRNINYALLSFLTGSAVNFLFTFYYVIRRRLVRPVSAGISTRDLKKLMEFVLMALSVLAFGKLVEFYIRSMVIGRFGMNLTGLWQAVVKMSDGYTMVFINTVGVVYYPQVSALIFDPDELRPYLRDVLKIVTALTVGGLLLVFACRYPLLSLLYNDTFRVAADLMPLQLIGDFFCILSYLLTYIISAQARTSTFIALQGLSAVFYVLLIHFLIPWMQIMALPAAHAIRYVLYFIILVFLNRRLLF